MLSGFAYVYTVRCNIPIELQRFIIVTVAVPRVCVCVCVCHCVCVCVCLYIVFCHRVHLHPEIQVRTCSPRHGKLYIAITIVIFAENASFRSYGQRHLLVSNATNCS